MTSAVPYVETLTAPAAEPVTLAEAKTWCRVDADQTDQDAVVTLLVQAARERAEDLTGRAFVYRRLELRLDAFPDDVIEIPFAPLIAVEYVRYLDSTGAEQSMVSSPSSWIEDTVSQPGRIQPVNGWPAAYNRIGAVRIGFQCGYAPGSGSPTDYAANVPALLKTWMHARVSSWFEHRAQLDLTNLKALPRDFVDGLLDGLKVNRGFA